MTRRRLRVALWPVLVLSALILFTPLRTASTADNSDPVLSKYFVHPKSDKVMREIADRFEVSARLADGFEVIVPAHRADELRALAPQSRLLEKDISEPLRKLRLRNPEWLRGYHDFSQVEAALKQVAADHPDLAAFEVYGKSKEGRPLMALKLSANVALDEEEPEIMLTSATHGDELVTVEVLLGLLDKLVKGYKVDERITRFLEKREIFFIPVVNPDGFVRQTRYANGVDPNREYPWPEKPDRNPNECIKNIMAFFHKHHISGSIDFHSSGQMIMTPWAYTEASLPGDDATRFRTVTRAMAQTNGYQAGQISQMLYVAKGSSADYYYWKNKSLSLGIEIGTTNVPSASQLPSMVTELTEATWIFLESFK